MEFRRFLLAGAGALTVSSFAPTPEAPRPLPVDPVVQMNADAAHDSSAYEGMALDPVPTERGRYSCRSRSMHGAPFYFSEPNTDNVPIDCEAGTTNLISRTIEDTSPPPAER